MYIHVSRNQNFDYFVILWRHTTCKGVFDIDVESLKISSNNYVFTIRHYLIIKLKKVYGSLKKLKFLTVHEWFTEFISVTYFCPITWQSSWRHFWWNTLYFFIISRYHWVELKRWFFHVLDCRNVFSWIYECEIKWHSIMIRCTLQRC